MKTKYIKLSCKDAQELVGSLKLLLFVNCFWTRKAETYYSTTSKLKLKPYLLWV